MVFLSSVTTGSDSESFQLAVLIVRVQVQAGGECAKITYSMRVRIAQARVAPNYVGCIAISPLTPESPGSDLNLVIRTNCMCSVKCAEAAWNYKSGRLGNSRHSALQITCIFLFFPSRA